MKIKLLASSLMLLALAFVSCDDNTDSIGSSLIDEVDKINIKADTFEISSRTIIADSVLARNITGYLGRVKDPETGEYKSDIFGEFFEEIADMCGIEEVEQ